MEILIKNLLLSAAILITTSTVAFSDDMTIEMLNKREDGARMVCGFGGADPAGF